MGSTTTESHTVGKAYLQIHIAVLLFGFTGILGKLIQLPNVSIVWYRLLLTVPSLLLLRGSFTSARALPPKVLFRLMGIGAITALHWLFFFAAIQASNVSIALSCLATTSIFTAFLEPIILKRPFKWYEALLGSLVVPGVILIQQHTDFGLAGILMGLFSALLAALFSILNKKMVSRYNEYAITIIELGSGWLTMSLILPFYYLIKPEAPFLPTGIDWLYLAILAFACTSFAFVISLRALKVLSAFIINLSINLEPVYAILLAYFLLGEKLAAGFYFGAAMILLAVFSYPILNKIFGKKANQKAH